MWRYIGSISSAQLLNGRWEETWWPFLFRFIPNNPDVDSIWKYCYEPIGDEL